MRELTDPRFFTNGIPVTLTLDEWRRHHLASFPAFANPERDVILHDTIHIIYSMFAGIASLWDMHDPDTYFEKVQLTYRLLVCWYIADMYPQYCPGIFSNLGLPLVRKKIGPIDLTFNAEATTGRAGDLLAPLLSNPFGAKAHLLLRSAIVRAKISNGRRY